MEKSVFDITNIYFTYDYTVGVHWWIIFFLELEKRKYKFTKKPLQKRCFADIGQSQKSDYIWGFVNTANSHLRRSSTTHRLFKRSRLMSLIVFL